MTAHYSAGEPVFGQCLSPGDGLTSLSSILGVAEGRKVKFKKSKKKKSLMLHSRLYFLPVNWIPSLSLFFSQVN